MIDSIKFNASKPLIVKDSKSASPLTDGNDVLEPMKRFKRELPLPQLGEQPDLSMEKVLAQQKEFYSHRGQVYEHLHNIHAAIASYRKAKYYEPSDTSLYLKIQRLQLQNLTDNEE